MCKSARFRLRDQPAGQSRDTRRHAQACRQKQSAYGSDDCPQPSLTTIFHRPKNDIGRVHRPGCEAETERSHFVASHVVRGSALREMASSGDAAPSPAETAAQVSRALQRAGFRSIAAARSATKPESSFAIESHEFTCALSRSKSFARRQRVGRFCLTAGQRIAPDDDDAGLAPLADGFVFLGFHESIVLRRRLFSG